MKPDTPQPERKQPRTPSRPDAQAVRQVASNDLLGAAKEIIIQHGGRAYRLRVTQSGKLILTA